ncbi:uncharacterized protein LOC121425150 [Lytechinus variegatus]|uniref:uncharacterized protein LOC121425150 n=1 Tax=Lytechinus variegatus TaxID=7654 RepID=UPI001BB1FC76|nr:uncharacterized protein LOC121425150 [Lytechinus variegatus]
MHSLITPVVFVVICWLSSISQAQLSDPDIRNITASAGDDVLLDCEPPDGVAILISWNKDNDVVQITDAYRDGRIFLDQKEGMVILNSELWDRGMYSCLILTQDSQIITHRFWLDIAPPTDSDVDSNSAFQCGYCRVRGKVVGGKVSNEGQSPWTVLLWNTNEGKPLCGGVLLNRRWVVTASHCFSLSGLSIDEFEIRLGEHDIESISDNERTFRAEQIIKHPNFNEQTYDSDIALIKLQQPVTYTDYIIPLCLPSELRAEELLKAGTRGFVTGWGNTEEAGDYSRYLRRVRLTIASMQDCGRSHIDIITNNMFCADGGRKADERDACQGDSGGPFVTKDNNRWYLLGIVSWGVGCARPGYPGVYTRVHRFRQWIMDLVQQDMQTCEESSFELGEDLRASIKESNNLRLLNQEQQRAIEYLQEELDRKAEEMFGLYERIEAFDCPDAVPTSTPTPSTIASTTTNIPVVTETRPSTTRAPIQEDAVPCRHNMCWHVSSLARCHGGYCICDSPNYSRISCLPIVGPCRIYRNNSYALATATFRDDSRTADTYACEGNPESNVHVISVYEGPVHTRPASPGDVHVRVTGGDQGPITLVFSSYEPVRWIVSIDEGIVVDKFVLTGYYLDLSSVEVDSLSHTNITVVTVSRVPFGYGTDGDGVLHTAEFLKYVQNTYGEVGSFSGTQRADRWVLTVPGEPPIVDSMGLPLPIIPMARVESTISRTEWTRQEFSYDASFSACHGDQYVKKLGGPEDPDFYNVRYVGVVLCRTPYHYKIFLADDPQGTFQNIGDQSGGGEDHCEFVGGNPQNQSLVRTSQDWMIMPAISGYYRSHWGQGVTFGDIGGGMNTWTGKIIVSWYNCGIAIP